MTDFNSDRRHRLLDTIQYDYRQHERQSFRATLGLIGISAALAVGVTLAIFYTVKPAHKPLADCTGCHQRIQAFEIYFRKAGSKNPVAMSRAVMSTRNPSLMSAIARVESDGNDLRNKGYRKRHDGPWMVNRYTWGKVSSDITEAALQAELVLNTHIKEEKSLVRGLNAYGGHRDKTNGKYAQLILAELVEVPR